MTGFIRLFCAIAILSALASGLAATLLAHGDIRDRILKVSARIESQGASAELHLKRGELYRLHHDWEKALSDYAAAEKLSQDLPQLAYFRGRLWLEADRPREALPYLDDFLVKNPRHVDTLLLRSRALGRVGRLAQGVEDLNRSILLHPRATPEFFLERAELQKRMGDITGAVRGLEEGIELLGPIVSLINTMVKLEVSAGRYDSALQHIQLLPQLLRGQAPWRARRAGVLM